MKGQYTPSDAMGLASLIIVSVVAGGLAGFLYAVKKLPMRYRLVIKPGALLSFPPKEIVLYDPPELEGDAEEMALPPPIGPISQEKPKHKGGRPIGSLSSYHLDGGSNIQDVWPIIRKAKGILEAGTTEEFRQYCISVKMPESTVRRWVKEYGQGGYPEKST